MISAQHTLGVLCLPSTSCRCYKSHLTQLPQLHSKSRYYRRADLRLERRTILQSANLAAAVATLQGGAEGIGALLEGASPAYYFLYLCCAGLGVPLSEDALVVWVGSKVWQGAYGTLQSTLLVLGIVYAGVVVSDLMTFSLGVLFRLGFLSRLQALKDGESSTSRALETVKRHSRTIGIVQRFSVGFRGPLCITAGLTGVPPLNFAGGACLGAVATMSIQIGVGYLMRHTANVYLATLALVGLPTLIGATTGPLATLVGFWYAGRQKQQNGDIAPTDVRASLPAQPSLVTPLGNAGRTPGALGAR